MRKCGYAEATECPRVGGSREVKWPDALDEVFTLSANRSQGFSRALLMEYRAANAGEEI